MQLQVQKREILGKGTKSLRKSGLIPAELYGHNFDNLHLSVPAKEFASAFREIGESAIVKIAIAGEKIDALVHDVQRNSLTNEITHVDFYRVRTDEKIKTTVPLAFVGESPAVKAKTGVAVKAIDHLEIEALPADLPHDIKVDIGGLTDVGTSVRVGDLKIPAGVRILIDPETVILTIIELAKEEAVEAPISVEDVKVEVEEKKKEREKEKQEK